ncbi:AsnC family transcriptional regulator [Oceanicola sp. 22II-s10i]|uniref:Lrp/AsnC ligand binding domain-containing protein n=1 Tax=Oceanicola sp. 22II-s10i TaxID=1317116 RepID=UPI000B521B2F|nr:Lrp/AsnC ligand binding domain-containing protein [Oceanicola sp. 22II-s10i]OWU83090.1 AsnC family transcriptional regulator [Oceanicola sp. 22II-s10i]
MQCVFIQLQCEIGKTYDVAEAIVFREFHSEIYSTSGNFDLLIKAYVPDGDDIGRFVDVNLSGIDGIVRSYTTLTFKAF